MRSCQLDISGGSQWTNLSTREHSTSIFKMQRNATNGDAQIELDLYFASHVTVYISSFFVDRRRIRTRTTHATRKAVAPKKIHTPTRKLVG